MSDDDAMRGRGTGPGEAPGADVRPGAGEIRSADAVRGAASGTAPVPLSVLDLVTVGSGRTATQALGTSVALARLAERHDQPARALVPGLRQPAAVHAREAGQDLV
ncbi:hypothetical protein ABZ509_32895, partial [Streptomyces lavendulocolor]